MNLKNAIAVVLMSCFSMGAMAQARPNVAVLATGGTIAAVSKNASDTVNYHVGGMAIDTLLNAVPEIHQVANITGVQVANVASPDMSVDVWLKLNKEIKKVLKDGADGVVITHGTDTIEETAFFLDMTLKQDKPVILVGAMRPANAISADGPMNLLQAVTVAADKEAQKRGVMVTMNDRINSAFYMSKTHTSAVDTFKSTEQGYLGQFVGTKPVFFYTPANPVNKQYFDVSNLTSLPEVAIVYLYVDATSTKDVAAENSMIDLAVKNGAKGIVIAGSGNGSLSDNLKVRTKELQAKGIPVVRASRTGSGFVSKNEKMGVIGSGMFNPQKARILLSLALTKTNNQTEIEKIFGTQ